MKAVRSDSGGSFIGDTGGGSAHRQVSRFLRTGFLLQNKAIGDVVAAGGRKRSGISSRQTEISNAENLPACLHLNTCKELGKGNMP